MGLDSVELIMEVENYFGISIPDSEAEKSDTVDALVATVARQLSIADDNTLLREEVFERVNRALIKLGLSKIPLTLIDHISNCISPKNQESWGALENELFFDIPKPEIIQRDSKRLLDKIKWAMNWTPTYDWTSVNVEQFVAVICAKNYEQLIDREYIKSTYEIYVAISAITAEKLGVDYYEIAPEKSFTSDLGVS